MSDGPIRVWNVQGTPYPVVRRKIADDLEGEFVSWDGEIRVSEDVPPLRFWEVEAHEIFHACEYAQDLERRLKDDFGLPLPVIERIRELYAGSVVPVFLDTLERNGCLKRPPPPPTQPPKPDEDVT